MKLSDFNNQQTVRLDAIGSWPATAHRFYPDHVKAAVAAFHANRPLLVKGEPGIGKSQLARAIAQTLGWQFIDVNIQPRTEYQDLLWEFDAVGRLAQAQLLGAMGAAPDDDAKLEMPPQLALENYIVPGPLWWAVRPASAADTTETSLAACKPKPERVDKPEHPNQLVLLIDEIDKADANLPNGLLEFMGNGDFTLPIATDQVEKESVRSPLVIITSNNERELPPAFVRRCFVLNMALPEDEGELAGYLIDRATTHQEKGMDAIKNVPERILEKAAEKVVAVRKNTPQGIRKPSPAEYLDLLRALGGMQGQEEMDKLLDDLEAIIINKSNSG